MFLKFFFNPKFFELGNMLQPLHLAMPLTLASNSPRRKELLQQAGIPFTVLASEIPEDFPSDLPVEKVPAYLAEKKASAIWEILPQGNHLVLAADTIVEVNGQILNKPGSPAEAMEMLDLLSGKAHRVYTAFCLKSAQHSHLETDRAEVHFKVLADWEKTYYLRQGSAMDKAGAYGIQDYIGMIGITRLEGSFYTVMGLPIRQVYEALLPFILDAAQLPLGN